MAQFEESLSMLSNKENTYLSSAVHYNMGLTYVQLRKQEQANYHFDKAMRFDKQIYPPKINPEIIVGYKSLNVYASAEQEYNMVSHLYRTIMNISPKNDWRFLPNIGSGYSSLVGLYSVKKQPRTPHWNIS